MLRDLNVVDLEQQGVPVAAAAEPEPLRGDVEVMGNIEPAGSVDVDGNVGFVRGDDDPRPADTGREAACTAYVVSDVVVGVVLDERVSF